MKAERNALSRLPAFYSHLIVVEAPSVAPMSTRGDGRSRVLETCLAAGACAFTVAGWTYAHATRPKTDRVHEKKRFPRPAPGFHGSGTICTWKGQGGKQELTRYVSNTVSRRGVRLAWGMICKHTSSWFRGNEVRSVRLVGRVGRPSLMGLGTKASLEQGALRDFSARPSRKGALSRPLGSAIFISETGHSRNSVAIRKRPPLGLSRQSASEQPIRESCRSRTQPVDVFDGGRWD